MLGDRNVGCNGYGIACGPAADMMDEVTTVYSLTSGSDRDRRISDTKIKYLPILKKEYKEEGMLILANVDLRVATMHYCSRRVREACDEAKRIVEKVKSK